MIKMESISKKREAIIINRNDLLILAISFLISRVEVLNQLTPFGIAYLGASLLLGRGSFALALSIVLGIFSCQGFGGTSYALAILVIYTYFSRIKPSRSYTIFKGSFLVGQLFFIINILLSFIGGNLAYSLLITLFESLLIFTMTYVFTFSITIDKRKLRSISNEELICSILTMALILSGFGDISIYGLSIKNILSISIILYISNEQGSLMGVATAVVIGMVSYISHVEMPFIISVLAVGALLSGIFRDLGKYGSILGFILGNAIISYYINNFATSFLNLKEILIASIIFMTLCKYLKFDLREYIEGNLKIKEKYSEQREAYLLGKLDKTKDLLYSLSGIIEDSVGKEQLHTNKDVYSLVDEITNKSCKGCESYEKCWKDDYLTTSKTILNLIGQIETRAKSHEELLNQLDGKCHSAEELLELALESHQVFINGQTLNNKLLEHRKLLGEQIKNLGKVVEDIERSISTSPIFHTEIEESLIKELRNKKIEVVDLVVLEVEEGNLEILLELDMSRNIRYGIVEIKNQISKELNIPFSIDYSYGSIKNDIRSFKLKKTNRFNTFTKIAHESNSENLISGDNYTFGELNGNSFMAISDGMGIGKKANEESSIAINLIEKMMEINMDKNTIIRSVNSILRAKSKDEIFTTLDLGFVDLYTGKLQILKNGSPPTFIKRGDKVLAINSRSLPIGILENVDYDIYEESLEDGDIIIMMSDGILESNRQVEDLEKWMENTILGISSKNPNIIADEILNIGKLAGDSEDKDDMTVMVTRVWKSA